jgi:hypothetical protein
LKSISVESGHKIVSERGAIGEEGEGASGNENTKLPIFVVNSLPTRLGTQMAIAQCTGMSESRSDKTQKLWQILPSFDFGANNTLPSLAW